MRLLGVDAGFSAPGAVIVDYSSLANSHIVHVGCVTNEKEKASSVALDDIRRIGQVVDFLRGLVSLYQPELAIIELPLSGARSARAIKGMAYATAIAVTVVQVLKVPFIPINPYENKRLSAGAQHAEKEEVISAVHAVWEDIPWPMKVSRGKMTNRPDERQQEAIADALSTIIAYSKLGDPASRIVRFS